MALVIPTAGLALPAVQITANQASARTLLFATLDYYPLAVSQIMYRDTVTGPWRVFMYARNGTQTWQICVITARNPGSSPMQVQVEAAGHGDPVPVQRVFGMGTQAALRWMASIPQQPVVVAPGQEVVLDSSPVPAGTLQVWESMVDGTATGPVVITAYAMAPGELFPVVVVPSAVVRGDQAPRRGTFRNADVALSVAVPRGGGTLGFPPPPWSRTNVERAPSAVDPTSLGPGVDNGSWGYVYTITADTAGDIYQLAFVPTAGQGLGATGAFLVGGSAVAADRGGQDVHFGQAAVFWQGGDLTMLTTPTGGSYYPSEILWLPVSSGLPAGAWKVPAAGAVLAAAGVAGGLLLPAGSGGPARRGA